MTLPHEVTIAPMLASPVPSLPDGEHYEPKWDGFRCIAFRDDSAREPVFLASRGGKPLTRYFPEVVAALMAMLPDGCIIDGEIIMPIGDRLDFDSLTARIHPATSRVAMLAETTPAWFVAFDILADDRQDTTRMPLVERREVLKRVVASSAPPVFVTPMSEDPKVAQTWFTDFESAGLDGVISKPLQGAYQPNIRGWRKWKHSRTADCVVAGFRWHTSATPDDLRVGSILLGLYEEGHLHHVGVCGAFTAARRKELVGELGNYALSDTAEHPWLRGDERTRVPGGESRWTGGKDLSFVPLRPELVVEVGYDHLQSGRFRHTAQFKRWRPDRDPSSCTYAQLELPGDLGLSALL